MEKDQGWKYDVLPDLKIGVSSNFGLLVFLFCLRSGNPQIHSFKEMYITHSAVRLPALQRCRRGHPHYPCTGNTHCLKCGNMQRSSRRECRSSSRCRTVSGSGFPVSILSTAGHRWPGSRYGCPPARSLALRRKYSNSMPVYGIYHHSNTGIPTDSNSQRSCHILHILGSTGGIYHHSNMGILSGSSSRRLCRIYCNLGNMSGMYRHNSTGTLPDSNDPHWSSIYNSRNCMSPNFPLHPMNCHLLNCRDNRSRAQK
jgi:hypothetical protein